MTNVTEIKRKPKHDEAVKNFLGTVDLDSRETGLILVGTSSKGKEFFSVDSVVCSGLNTAEINLVLDVVKDAIVYGDSDEE